MRNLQGLHDASVVHLESYSRYEKVPHLMVFALLERERPGMGYVHVRLVHRNQLPLHHDVTFSD